MSNSRCEIGTAVATRQIVIGKELGAVTIEQHDDSYIFVVTFNDEKYSNHIRYHSINRAIDAAWNNVDNIVLLSNQKSNT